MKEDKLSDLSMQLSVDVLKLTKELRAKHETYTVTVGSESGEFEAN